MTKKLHKKHIVAPTDCTGCSLCSNVCGHDAITMVWSQEGFLVPQVNEKTCIDCGVCVKKCPALQPVPIHQDELRNSVPSYGAWNRDRDVHMSSSSGGVFTALAEWTIARGGSVFGVVWKDKETAVFAKAKTMAEVSPMRGSKYIMAIPGWVYRDIRDELRGGRQVLFVGTPCQVHALRSFLVKSYEKLLTVDIVCHGVPSRALWQKFVRETENRVGKELKFVSFRDKDEHWLRYNVTSHFVDGCKESEWYGVNIFMRLFLSDVALNKCCYQCRYAGLPRQGDLTLGDFWGVQNYHPDWPLREGIASLLVNSSIGEMAREEVASQIEYRSVPFEELYAGQNMLHDKGKHMLHPNRSRMMARMHVTRLEQLCKRFVGTVFVGPFCFRTSGLVWRALDKLKRMFSL